MKFSPPLLKSEKTSRFYNFCGRLFDNQFAAKFSSQNQKESTLASRDARRRPRRVKKCSKSTQEIGGRKYWDWQFHFEKDPKFSTFRKKFEQNHGQGECSADNESKLGLNIFTKHLMNFQYIRNFQMIFWIFSRFVNSNKALN